LGGFETKVSIGAGEVKYPSSNRKILAGFIFS